MGYGGYEAVGRDEAKWRGRHFSRSEMHAPNLGVVKNTESSTGQS